MNFQLTACILLLIIINNASTLSAAPDKFGEVPWDTVVAELQIIDATKEPDSTKAALTQELFDNYDLQAEDYSRFYTNFLGYSPDRQLSFLKKVENIILARLKESQELPADYQKRE